MITTITITAKIAISGSLRAQSQMRMMGLSLDHWPSILLNPRLRQNAEARRLT